MHRSIAIPMWFPLPVFIICSPSWCCTCPVDGKEYVGWNQLKLLLFLKYCWLFSAYVGLSHIYIPPVLVWLTQTFTLFWWNWGETFIPPVDPLNWHNCLSKAKATLQSPLCWGKVNLFATAVISHTLRFFLSFTGTLPLPISSEPSVIGSVTVFEYFSFLNLQGFETH